MKRKYILAIGFVLSIALILTGCGSGNSDNPYDFDLSEYVTLGQYKGIEAPIIPVDITDQDVQDEIKIRLEAAATTEEITTGAVKDGDVTNIDYEGRLDGVAFEGGTAQGQSLTIGSGAFIPGFEEGLIGTKIGDTKVLELTFPEGYPNNPDLAGKAVEFTVKVNSVTTSIVPAYDLAFIEANSDYKTVPEYEEYIRQLLYDAGQKKADSDRENVIWSKIMENATIIKYPEARLEEQKAADIAYYESLAAQYQITIEQYAQMAAGMTTEQFYEAVADQSKGRIEQEMVIWSIARAEGLEMTEEEYQEGYNGLLKEQGFESDKDFKEAAGMTFEENVGKAAIQSALLFEKVNAFVVAESIS